MAGGAASTAAAAVAAAAAHIVPLQQGQEPLSAERFGVCLLHRGAASAQNSPKEQAVSGRAVARRNLGCQLPQTVQQRHMHPHLLLRTAASACSCRSDSLRLLCQGRAAANRCHCR